MAANIIVPDVLKQVKPYITLSDQLELKGDKIASYYCRFYAMQTGMAINKTAPECKKFLLQLMDLLEKSKSQLKGDETIKDESVAQAYMEKYVLSLFKKADDDDRAARFSRNLIKQFYTAGLLFDVLNTFGDLSEDLVSVKKYAKTKAMYIKKCLDNNETPIAGPLVSDEAPNIGDLNIKNDQDTYEPQQPFVPHNTYTYEQPTVPAASSSSDIKNNAISTDQILQAQKLCKFATNALQYEDIPTAIDNLEKCLKLLKTGK